MKYLRLDIMQQIINNRKMVEMLNLFHFQSKLYHWVRVWVMVFKATQQYFNYIGTASFIDGGNRSTVENH
jgi:hypothetical protein